MKGLDTKLFSAINHVVAQLPAQDGVNLAKIIRDSCKGNNDQPNFCGRQALRLMDCYFEHSSARRSKAHVQELFTMEVKNRDLEEFVTRWDTVTQKLFGSNDLPSVLSLGSLLENKISKAFKNDPMKEMLLMEWRRTTMTTTYPREIERAYESLLESLRSMCRIERIQRMENHTSGHGAAAAQTKKKKAKDMPKPDSSKKAAAAAPKSSPTQKGGIKRERQRYRQGSEEHQFQRHRLQGIVRLR